MTESPYVTPPVSDSLTERRIAAQKSCDFANLIRVVPPTELEARAVAEELTRRHSIHIVPRRVQGRWGVHFWTPNLPESVNQ